MEKFKKLGLSESSLRILENKGFEEPTEIQEKTIPVLLTSNQNVIAQAQTGTGKTATFGLAFIEKLIPQSNNIQALVLTPTRELAIQVAEEISSLKGDKRFNITPIYGGQSIILQLKQLKKGIDIVIGTPGRILDHLKRKSLNIGNIKYLVLDEADEMLNMGFIEDVEEIMKNTPKEKQTLLFSATMPDRIIKLAKKFMPEHILIETKKGQLGAGLIDQIYYEVNKNDVFEALCRIIDIESEFYGIIFCRTKIIVDEIVKKLNSRGYISEALHGDISQNQREKILKSFRDKNINILVATDVAARGIDVENLTHVINYSLPQDSESYIHRIGRTGRAGNEGVAITFVTPDEFHKLSLIKKSVKSDIRKEKIPDIERIISVKKEKISKDIKKITESNDLDIYKNYANTMFEGIDKDDLIAALFRYSFYDELDVKKYSHKELNYDSKKIYNKGKTRLFITLGKKDDMTPEKLASFIEREVGIDKNLIQDITVCEIYSFISVPFREAEQILANLKKSKRGNKIIVQEASDKKGGNNQKQNKKKRYKK